MANTLDAKHLIVASNVHRLRAMDREHISDTVKRIVGHCDVGVEMPWHVGPVDRSHPLKDVRTVSPWIAELQLLEVA